MDTNGYEWIITDLVIVLYLRKSQTHCEVRAENFGSVFVYILQFTDGWAVLKFLFF